MDISKYVYIHISAFKYNSEYFSKIRGGEKKEEMKAN